MAGALVLLGKKHREEFREKLEQEKKVHLEEEDPMPTPTSSWNPLRRIFSVFQNDEDEKMEDQGMSKHLLYHLSSESDLNEPCSRSYTICSCCFDCTPTTRHAILR